MKITEPARGAKRLLAIADLPVIDGKSEIKYEGSMSKSGDNADWDWGMYQDENGEWVLMEADGAGCIYNFTQHRYPTSEVPTFNFYFDNSTIPQFSITPQEFGTKAPFLKPLADKFVGPEDNGRGPIWVVRSFVPMEFCTHCKVTSTIKLEGSDKDLGQGGWGHIMYQLYENDEGLKTFDVSDDLSVLAAKYEDRLQLGSEDVRRIENTVIKSKNALSIANISGEKTITEIEVKIRNFTPEVLNGLFIKIYYDNFDKPFVEAPFGTFFGCEYGKAPANIETALLTSDFSKSTAYFSNRFPMPFFENASIVIENRLETDAEVNTKVSYTGEIKYLRESIGYFTSSEYYAETENINGKNSLIADVSGSGQMVYGVISGRDIACGCEGDVRVFIDGLSSPAVESDGSESWGSYGWGFVCPPQCNPFSAYNGVYGINDTWSELRLTFTDCYNFKSNLRFELEHGCQNDGGGYHSGQIFMYMKKAPMEVYVATVTPETEGYSTDGVSEIVTDRFENGIHENFKEYNCVRNMTYSEFVVEIPKENNGLVLKRTSLQDRGRMCAAVFVDGVKVDERDWLFPDSNTIYSLLDDSFSIPKKYTQGKKFVCIRIVPENNNWSECEYKVFALRR